MAIKFISRSIALKVLGRIFIGLLILAGGVGIGFYYHPEISVLLNGLFPLAAPTVPTPTATLNTENTLILPGISDPLPLVFSATLDEAQIQEMLKQGAVVLPLGIDFGQPGNVVVTAHSSGTAAFGPYRFAFARLAELQDGQTVTVKTPAADYTYKVYSQQIVWPHEVDKLPQGEKPTVTLVTCWPLWTNFKRLLVNAELIKTEYR